jgi:hypothetical protein
LLTISSAEWINSKRLGGVAKLGSLNQIPAKVARSHTVSVLALPHFPAA